MIKKDWWKEAEEEVSVDLQTQNALNRVMAEQVIKAKARIQAEKKKQKDSIYKPVLLKKMHSTGYWSELFDFTPQTIQAWCKEGVVEAEFIRGEWRITEEAMITFIEKERNRRVS